LLFFYKLYLPVCYTEKLKTGKTVRTVVEKIDLSGGSGAITERVVSTSRDGQDPHSTLTMLQERLKAKSATVKSQNDKLKAALLDTSSQEVFCDQAASRRLSFMTSAGNIEVNCLIMC
jgi:hypothetical protein